MKRLFGTLIFLAGFLLGASTLPAQERLTVLYPSPAGSWMIPVIAKEAKYFEKEGLSLNTFGSAGARASSQPFWVAVRRLFMRASRR